jgi:hypothetical protein
MCGIRKLSRKCSRTLLRKFSRKCLRKRKFSRKCLEYWYFREIFAKMFGILIFSRNFVMFSLFTKIQKCIFVSTLVLTPTSAFLSYTSFFSYWRKQLLYGYWTLYNCKEIKRHWTSGIRRHYWGSQQIAAGRTIRLQSGQVGTARQRSATDNYL